MKTIFERESRLQDKASRDFMEAHFTRGLPLAKAVFSKGTITSENMLSSNNKKETKVERFKRHLEMDKHETMALIKTENALMVK